MVDLHNTLKDDKEVAKNGFRSAEITDAIENAKDMVGKVENPFKEVRKTCFFYKHMKRQHDSFFFSF